MNVLRYCTLQFWLLIYKLKVYGKQFTTVGSGVWSLLSGLVATSGGVLFSVKVDVTIGSLQYDLLCFLRRLKSIWHEHSFLSVKTSVLKNSKLKMWENSVKERKVTTVWISRFSLKIWSFLLLCQNLVTWPKTQVVTSSGWFVNSFGSKTQQIQRKIPWSWLKQRISYKNTSYTHGVTIHHFPCDPERGESAQNSCHFISKSV